MHLDLALQGVPEQHWQSAAAHLDQRHTGFVARRLNPQHLQVFRHKV
jgi:hypothetical protein